MITNKTEFRMIKADEEDKELNLSKKSSNSWKSGVSSSVFRYNKSNSSEIVSKLDQRSNIDQFPNEYWLSPKTEIWVQSNDS